MPRECRSKPATRTVSRLSEPPPQTVVLPRPHRRSADTPQCFHEWAFSAGGLAAKRHGVAHQTRANHDGNKEQASMQSSRMPLDLGIDDALDAQMSYARQVRAPAMRYLPYACRNRTPM